MALDAVESNAEKCASVKPPCPSEKAVYTTVTTGMTRNATRNAAIAIATAAMPGWVRLTRVYFALLASSTAFA